MFRRTIAATLTAGAALALTLIPTPAHAAVANSFCAAGSIPGNPGVHLQAWHSGETPIKVDAVGVSTINNYSRVESIVVNPTIRQWNGDLVHNLANRRLFEGDSLVWDGAGTWNIPGAIRGRVRVDVAYHRFNGDVVHDTCVALLNP